MDIYIDTTTTSKKNITMQTHALNWFEIPATDLDRAIIFYNAILGNVRKGTFFGMELGLFESDKQAGGIGGSIVVRPDMKPSSNGSLLYINTNGHLDKVLSQVEAAGGKIIVPTISLGDFGWSAIIEDSEGNRVGLHQNK